MITKLSYLWRHKRAMKNGLSGDANMIRILLNSNNFESTANFAEEICKRSEFDCNFETVVSHISRWKNDKQKISSKYILIVEDIFDEYLETIADPNDVILLDKMVDTTIKKSKNSL
jgi:hypothetical protein